MAIPDINFTPAMRNIATSLANQKMQPLQLGSQPQTGNALLPNAGQLPTPTNDQRTNMAPADAFLKQLGRLLGNRPA